MRLFIIAAKLLHIYTNNGILRNYNRRKSNGRYNIVYLFLYIDIRTLKYTIFNYTTSKLFKTSGRFKYILPLLGHLRPIVTK
jgi:hypothetical protein